MTIYTFAVDGQEFAYTSLAKAKSARAKMLKRSKRPEIYRVTLPDRLNKQDACNLLMRRNYALSMEDVA